LKEDLLDRDDKEKKQKKILEIYSPKKCIRGGRRRELSRDKGFGIF